MSVRPINVCPIIVKLPTISMMKMETRLTIPFTGFETLREVKEKIFETVWKTLPSNVCQRGKHGSWEDVILKCDQEEICSDEQLRQRLVCFNCFQATFKKFNKCERKSIVND
jgi:hypothetical protein